MTRDFHVHLLLDAIPAIVWSADARTLRFTYVNGAAESILGFPAERWIDDPNFWSSHLHPEDAHIAGVCQSETAAGRDHELVYRMLAADGRVVWLRDSVKVRVVDGVAVDVYGVMIDITREREAEAELSESRENFKRLVERSPDCIGVHIDGSFVYVNEAFVRLLGANTPGDIIGRGGASFAHPEFLPSIRERHARLRAGEAVPYERQRFVRLDGSSVDVETAALPIVYDGRNAVQLIVRDISSRVVAEERLRARESRLQTLAAGTNEAIWEWDLESGEVWTNAAHRELFGKRVNGEGIFEDWISRVHPDDAERVRANGLAAVAGDVPSWRHEYQFRTAEGSYRVLLDRGRNVIGSDGKRRIMGATLDITALREAERERATVDAKYRSIVEQSLVGVYTRAGQRITYMNRTGLHILGYTLDELLGFEDATSLMRPGDRETFLRSGKLSPIVRAMHKDGRELYLSVFENPFVAEGEADVYIGTLVDVTAQYAAERDLIDSERRYRELVDSVGDILYTIDANGVIVSLSRSFERISGYSTTEWIGRSFVDLFEPDSVPAAIDHFHRSMAGNADIIRQYNIRSSTGAVLTIEVTSQPRFVEGVVAGTVGVARDVTQIRNAQRQLDEAKRLASLGQLAASLAHEFNNVLMGIQPFVEVLARNTPPAPRVTDCISHINRAIARGKRASQEILRFANPQQSRVTDVDAANWLPAIVNHLRPAVPTEVAIRSTVGAGVKTMKVDREQLDQVMTNLVFNARDAMSGRGTIDLSVDLYVPPVSQPGQVSRFVRISVKDDGPGIPRELAARVFEPLFTTKRNGTGLGLPIARRLIETIGGSLRLVPAKEGTHFDILVPEGDVAESHAAPAATHPTSARRVLLVEDDDAVGAGLSALLECEGFETTWVRDVASAIEEGRRSRPDVAVIDVNLSDGSGMQLIPILRETWRSLPIVLSTGHVEFNLKGTDDHTIALLKPYEIGDLLGAISRVSSSEPRVLQ
jgi:two-component system cell cycle sensor histidine kinase/response regulator CckA